MSNKVGAMLFGALLLIEVQGQTVAPQPAVPAPLDCVDAGLIDCNLPGMCEDAEFAALLCPVTCGRCSNLIADCSVAEPSYCLDHPEVCRDIELAVTMCPYLCGFCGAAPPQSSPPPTEAATPSSDPTLPKCPTCFGAIHTLDCLENLQTCATSTQVCKGSMDDWHLSMGCTSELICRFEELQSSRNCTSGQAFAPQEHCTFCCQGDDCPSDLALVQQGLDSIASVLHCPSCRNAADPRECAERIIPCAPEDNVCNIVNDHGVFTANCSRQDICTESSTSNNCRLGFGVCSSCCQTNDCVSRALAGIAPTNVAASVTPTKTCQDADYYPCVYAQSVACNDADMSLTVCPVTCGRCDEL